MATKTTNLSIRMDMGLKKDAEALFDNLGMNLSTAFHVFIRQSLRVQGLPFAVTLETPNAETRKAIQEAEQIAHDLKVKGFRDVNAALRELKS